MANGGPEFEKLVDVMRTLRSPEGCPWDREQTLKSLTHYVLEEAHEVVDAIERGDAAALREEIGDHIFEGVFLAQVAAEDGLFTVADSLRTVAEKLVRRHPHVFQDDGRLHDAASSERAPSADAALQRWNSLKAQERERSGTAHTTLGSVPRSLPSLLRAFKIAKRAASTGFDWDTATDVIAKIEEEVAELRETLTAAPQDRTRAEEEMGDLLFAIASLSRKLDIEPEAALRRANDKFTRRFEAMEKRVTASGRTLEQMTLAQMEEVWEEVKQAEHEDPQTARGSTNNTEIHERHEGPPTPKQ
jgi:ATP diphosphatase